MKRSNRRFEHPFNSLREGIPCLAKHCEALQSMAGEGLSDHPMVQLISSIADNMTTTMLVPIKIMPKCIMVPFNLFNYDDVCFGNVNHQFVSLECKIM
jgi:hypothetical protein